MKLCFTKHGNIIEEYALLNTSWKNNCIEMIWDIDKISKNQKSMVISQFGFEKRTIENANIELVIIPNLKNRLLRKLFNNLFYQIVLFTLLRKKKVTHLIPADSRGFGFFLLCCTLLKIKTIPNLSRENHLNLSNLMAFKLFKINSFIVPGYYYKKNLIKKGLGKEETIKVRQPHYPESFTQYKKLEMFNQDTFNVLYTGRLIKAKGINEFIEAAIAISLENNNNINFYVAGNGNEFDSIKEKIKANNLEKRIYLLGNFSNLGIGNLMLNSNLLVFPSHTEGFAKTWIESIITFTPTVLTPLPAITDILKDKINSFHIPINSSANIKKAILHLSNSPHIIQQLREELIKTKKILAQQKNGNFKECVEQLIFEK
jgi:glycosyltransferase involved in cell wall biosynthesis